MPMYNDVVWLHYFFLLLSVSSGMCESGESWAEVPDLFCHVLEEDDGVKQCALLKKVLLLLYMYSRTFSIIANCSRDSASLGWS